MKLLKCFITFFYKKAYKNYYRSDDDLWRKSTIGQLFEEVSKQYFK